MLSLNKLSTIVQVRDNIYPVTIHYEIEISQEDSYDAIEEVGTETGIEYLLMMAKKHKAKNKVTPEKYYPAWCQSMKEIIFNNGLSEQEFLQLCLKA